MPKITQSPTPLTEEDVWRGVCESYADQAAMFLYGSVRPLKGLRWHELTDGQRAQYRVLIEAARNATAMAAAMEAAHPADINGAEI